MSHSIIIGDELMNKEKERKKKPARQHAFYIEVYLPQNNTTGFS